MASALDELRRGPQLDDSARRFGDSFFQEPDRFSTPSEKVASSDAFAQEEPQQRRVNRFKAADLADRGIPAYKNEHGDVAAVTDETGAALNAFDSRHSVAYDSKGQPKAISYGETGGPIVKDAFADIPAVTDPETGNIEKRGRGLYQYLGQNPDIAAANLQAAKDKEMKAQAGLLQQKITLDHSDEISAKHDVKALHASLTDQVPTLIDPKFQNADHETVAKAISDHFDAQYGADDANAKNGWFGAGPYTPEAQARRDEIDAAKEKALGTAETLFQRGDELNALGESGAQARQDRRDRIETLLAHSQGQAGPLDETSPPSGGVKAAEGLYPPIEDQPRMLGGQAIEPDKIMPNLGAAGKVKNREFTPREQLDAPYVAGQPSYRVGDDHSFHLDPNNMMKGLRQGIEAGIIDPGKAKALTPDLRKVQDAINEQRKVIDESGGSKVAATLHGAGLGAAFMAGAAPGAAAGAEIGAAAGIPTGGISIAAAGIVGGLIGGTVTAFGAKKLIDKLAETNDTIRTFTDAADMHPYYDAAGNLISMGAGIPTKLAKAGVALAAKTGSKAAQSIAESYLNSSGGLYRTVTNLAEDASIRKAGGASAATVARAIGARVGGAAALNVAIDTVLNEGGKALGIQKEGETWPKAFMAAMIGSFVSGHGISFKNYKPGEVADILVRAKSAMDAGKDINTVLSSAESEAFNAFSTELKRKINTGEIPIDTDAVAGTVRQALQGGKNYGVAAAEITGKGGTSGPPEGPTAPKPGPAGPTKPVEPQPAEKPAKATEVQPKTPKGGEAASGKKEENAAQKGQETADRVLTGEKGAASNEAVSVAEKAFVEQGGHADKLDAQNKLAALREAFPDPAARIKAIEDHLSISSTSDEGAKVDKAPKEIALSSKDLTNVPQNERAQYLVARGELGGGNSHQKLSGEVGSEAFDAFASDSGRTTGPQHSVFIGPGGIMTRAEMAKAGLPTHSQEQAKASSGAASKSSTQVNIPAAAAEPIHSFVKTIAEGDLYKGEKGSDSFGGGGYGRETEPHVTALYGITHNDVGAIAARVKGHGPVTLTLGKISKFSSPDKPYDVLKVDVKSPDLHLLNATLKKEPYSSDFPKYVPHLTLAYVKKGAADKYVGDARFEGQTVTIPHLTFSDSEGTKTKIALSAKKETKSDEQKSAVTQGKSETKPAEQRSGGLAGERTPAASFVPEKRGEPVRTVDDAKSAVTASKEFHAKEIADLGINHVERTLGKSGLGTERDGSAIITDYPAIVTSAEIVEANGGDARQFIQDGLGEEVRWHYPDLLVSGNRFALIHVPFWSELDAEAKAAFDEAYPGLKSPLHKGAEYFRMVGQYRELGHITESNWRNTDRIAKVLQGKQSDALEAHLERVIGIRDEKAPSGASTETIPRKTATKEDIRVTDARLTRNAKRSAELGKRFNALPEVPATEMMLINTLLRSPNGKALDQAETRIAKLEEKYAIREQGPAGVLQHPPEGAGEQTGGRVQPGEQGPTRAPEARPQEEKPTGRTETGASQELIDKGKKAFEGLFAGLPRYEGQIATKGSQVSEGDLEQLRKSNEERLRNGEEPLPAEGFGASKPISQLPIPKDKRAPMFDLIDAMEKEGITTPEKVAGYLEAISGGKARPYSQSLWDIMAAAGAVERGTHDWATVYKSTASNEAVKYPTEATIKPQNADQLSKAVAFRLRNGPLDRRALTELAKEAGLSVKAVDEAAELGIVFAARDIASGPGDVAQKFDSLVELYNRQPNLTAKTSTSKVNQAYSTPAPLAFAASHLAAITGQTSVYEPTAGNGMLLIGADPDMTVVNELDPARAAALKSMGFDPHVEDATKFIPKEKVDRVIENPPFGRIVTDEQTKQEWPLVGTDEVTKEIDQAIAMKSLSAMEDNGRAVLIMGGKNKLLHGDARAAAYATPDQAKFWKPLYENYRVVDHFTVSGDLYAKQGAGWPVDVVVIAGRGKSPIQLPSADGPRILNSWDDLKAELNRTDADRIAAGRYDAERDRAKLGGVIGAIRGVAAAPAAPGSKGSPQRSPGQSGTAATGTDLSASDQGQQPVVSGRPGGGEVSESRSPGTVGTGATPGQPEQPGQQLTEDFRVPYKPASKLPSFKIFVPTNMEVPAREALAKLEGQVGSIDDYVRGKLGYRSDAPLDSYFSAEQMDALALGVYAIENQTAFVLGDQGGVGKGRVAAGMMAYAIHQGKLPIFITKDVKLYAAMIEDLHDIGKGDIVPLFTDNDISFVDYAETKWKQGNMNKVMKEIARTGKLSGADALFTTYSQIASDVPPKYSAKKAERNALKAAHRPPPDGARMEALKRLAPGSVIIADESHLAAGDSIRAWRLAPLLAQAHGVYYSSATFAKRPDSMGIYSRTSLSHATGSTQDLIDAMKAGGVPLQQVVSATLAADGLYLRRERDFSKAVFKTHINLETKDRDTHLADNYTDGLRSILSISNKMADARLLLNRILRREGKKMQVANAPRIETTNFASKLHNLISQYLFAIKAESMVRRAVEGVTKGFTNVEGVTIPHKVIVAFQNTMEQPILALERSQRPLNFNGMLLAYLDSQRILTSGHGQSAQTVTITDKPDPNFENLSDQQLEKILIGQVIAGGEPGEDTATVNEPALAELFRRIMAGVFTETEAKLEKLDLADMPLSPIDHIKRQLTLAGIKSAEITKRGTGIDEDGAIYRLHPNSNTKAAHLRYLSDFNNSDTDVLLINASGSTGISAHSSAKFKRTDPRAMIIGQPHLDINEFMQTTYRIDRTGQVHQPYYELLQTAIPAELRPAAILGKKMSKLNANTTSNAESEISEGNKGTDIFNQYGDEMVYNYLKSDRQFTVMLDMPKIMDGDNLLPIADVMALYEENGQFAAAVTGRAAVLPTEEQEVFWEKVMADYLAHIAYLNELGENELISDTVDLKAETLESKELTPAKSGGSGFDAASTMEKIKADIGLKPLAAPEVVSMMEKLGENAYEIRTNWHDRVQTWKVEQLTHLQEKVLSWDEEKQRNYEARWREQEEEISAALGLIGSGLHIKTEKGMDGYGAITAVQLDDEHPLTPSKQIFTVHVNTTKKTIRVPASQLPTIARYAVGEFADVYEASAERSNQRYMITGNLLAAYLAIKDSAPTAKIVQYTTDKGDLRQGILMPAKFTPGMLAKKRVVESAKHMLELLQAGRSLTNAGAEVSLVKAPSGGFVIRVPASRTMGGAFWRDSQLAKLMDGGEFVERGGAMIGKFGYDNSHLIYQRLLDLQATLFYTDAPEEALGAARPVRAAVAFKDDVEKVAKDIGMGVKEALRMTQHLVSPTTGVAMDAQDAVMRMLGERNQKGYQVDRVLDAARQSFDKMPRPEQIAFIDKMKLGEAQATPELQQVAEVMRKIDTESWQAAHDAYVAIGFKDKEVPLAWLENHYRVLWKKIPGSDEDEKVAWIGKARRGLRGSMGQHKQHTLETMSDGLETGGVPYSYNPVEMFKLAQADLWKLTSTLKAWKWAKDNGFVEFVRGAFPKAPDGMVQLDDAIANVYFPAESGEGLIHAGKYFVEEGFGRLLNNYLSKDYIRQAKIGRGLLWLKNATTSIELSLSPFHGVFETLEAVGSNIGHGLTKLVNRGVLKGNIGAVVSGLHDMTIGAIASPVTGFNLGRQIQIAAIDPEAYFKTTEGQKLEKSYPGARQAINALWAGGWKPNQLEQDWKNASIRAFVEAVSDIKAGSSDNYIGAGLRAVPAVNEMLMKPLFDHYIPNLKVAQFFKEFLEAKQQNERKLKGGVLTDAALARQVWRFVEDRFGEMNFDTIFWNANFKTAMQLMFRSVTWKLGSLEAFAGAFAGQGKEFRDAFKERRAPELHRNMAWLFGMFLLTATLGTIISLTLGQKKPKNLVDLVFPQIDPKNDKVRVSLPTYFKDLVHLIHSPTSYVTASMSGWIGRVADLLRNKDYYGVQIRDTDDSVVKQALAVGKYAGQTLLPFSIRGYKNLSAQDVDALRKTLALLAINPAPRYISQSAAEKASEEYWKGTQSEAGLRPEQFEAKIEKRKLVTQIQHGKAPNISAALAAGTIKPTDVKGLYQRAAMGPLASQVLHMPLAEAERIFAKASPEEKRQLTPIMAKKRLNSARRHKTLFQGF